MTAERPAVDIQQRGRFQSIESRNNDYSGDNAPAELRIPDLAFKAEQEGKASENGHNRRYHRERGKEDSHHTRIPRENVQS